MGASPADVGAQGRDSVGTVEAAVGKGRSPSMDVPARVGAFEHREVPNTNTTTWARSWRPVDGEPLPRMRLTYSITCEHGPNWQITRSAVLENISKTVNLPSPKTTRSQDVRDVQTVAAAETREQAVEIAVECMQAANALPDHTPPVISDVGVASFRDLERGGDGQVSEEEVQELVHDV